VPSNPAPLGDAIDYFDRFGVHNQVYAPQVGVSAEVRYRFWFLQATGKLGLGLLHAATKEQGGTAQQRADGTVSQFSGGVLVPSPASVDEDRLSVLSELGLTVGCQVASWCRLSVGYDFLFASQVVRAGHFIGGVNSAQVPQLSSFDPTRSGTSLVPHPRSDSFWAQGLTAGLEFRY
jgi:hypothetical protein